MCERITLEGGLPWGLRIGRGANDSDSYFKLTKVRQGGLAFKHGLREGDYILRINGVPLHNLVLSQAVRLIRDTPEGCSLTLDTRPASISLVSLTNINGESRIVNCIGSTTKVHKPVAFGPGKDNYSSTGSHSGGHSCHSFNISSAADTHHLPSMSAAEEPTSEIPDSTAPTSGGGKSKGVNLFLARQKLIADMMAAEEEAERAAEEAKIREVEEKRKEEELRRKQEAERLRLEELKHKEREKLEESERAKAARAARFRSSKPLPAQKKAEPEMPWVKKKSAADKSSASASVIEARVTLTTQRHTQSVLTDAEIGDDDHYLRISESPPHTNKHLNTNNEVQLHNPQISESSDLALDPKNLPEFELPKSQLPTVTLLQKSREACRSNCNGSPSSSTPSDMHKIRKCLASPASHTAGQIPKGALYVGTNERIEGGYKHTDEFFLVPAESQSTANHSQQREDNPSTPYSESRSTTARQSKNVHKTKEGCSEKHKVLHKPETKRETHESSELPSASVSHVNIDSGGDAKNNKYTGKKRAGADKSTTHKHEQTTSSPNVVTTDSHKLASNTCGVMVSDTVRDHWKPPEYSVNRSSSLHTDYGINTSLSIDTSAAKDNPFNFDSTTTASQTTTSSSGFSPQLPSPSIQYREIQRGGEIPFSGLRKPAPVTPPPRAVSPPPYSRHPEVIDNVELYGSSPVPITLQTSANIAVESDGIHHPEVINRIGGCYDSSPPLISQQISADSRSEETRTRRRHRSEYRAESFVSSLIHSQHTSSTRRSITPSPTRTNTTCIARTRQRANPRPASLNLEQYRGSASAASGEGYIAERASSPASSFTSTSTNNSRASSRRSLIIVPPKAGVFNAQRSTIQEGIIPKKCHTISATEQLNVNVPSPLKVKLTEVPRQVPAPVVGYNREPAPVTRDQRDISDARRREILSKVEQDERRKKARQEETERRSRRHSDYFTWKDKSPIPHNRYDRTYICSASAPHSPARSTTSQNSPRSVTSENTRLSAVALYQFNAHHPRELAVNKDDRIVIIRQVDANWYEAFRGDRRGIIPVSYVQVLKSLNVSPPPPTRPSPPRLREGSAVAKYNFNPQTGAELALKKGDRIFLTRRVDGNWYEGRLQDYSRGGIFPVSYVQVISEPESPSYTDGRDFQQAPPLVNRSQSAPTGCTRQGSLTSPQLLSPLGRTPSSGYGSPDHLTLYNSNSNNNYDSTKVKSNTSYNGHLTEDADTNTPVIRPYRGLEMPSYKSLYNYEPRNADELELYEGDIVHVIEKCADGWFVGTSGRTGMFGTFPGNYVTPV